MNGNCFFLIETLRRMRVIFDHFDHFIAIDDLSSYTYLTAFELAFVGSCGCIASPPNSTGRSDVHTVLISQWAYQNPMSPFICWSGGKVAITLIWKRKRHEKVNFLVNKSFYMDLNAWKQWERKPFDWLVLFLF